MTDVKGRLQEILNTTLGNIPKQNGRTEYINKRETTYNPFDEYKALDISINNLRRKKSLSRVESNPNHSTLNRSKVADTSFTVKNNQHNLNVSTATANANDTTTFVLNKSSNNKIKKEIENLRTKILNEGVNISKNRPIINLNKPMVSFKSEEYYTQSPTLTRKSYLTTSNIFKNYKFDLNTNTNEHVKRERRENKFESLMNELLMGKPVIPLPKKR